MESKNNIVKLHKGIQGVVSSHIEIDKQTNAKLNYFSKSIPECEIQYIPVFLALKCYAFGTEQNEDIMTLVNKYESEKIVRCDNVNPLHKRMLGSLSWDLRCVFYELYPDIHTYLTKRRKRSMSADTVIKSYDALSQSWSKCKSFLGESNHETKYIITDLPKDIGKHSLFPVKNETGGELSEDTSAEHSSKSQASETEKTTFTSEVKNATGGELSDDTSAKHSSKSQASETEKPTFTLDRTGSIDKSK